MTFFVPAALKQHHFATPQFISSIIFLFNIIAQVKDAAKPGNGDDPNSASETQTVTEPNNQYSAVAVIKVFLNARNGSWILTTLFAGTCNGVIWGFLFWHIDNLGLLSFFVKVSNCVG